MNKVMLLGYVGNQPEINTTKEGKIVANFSVATNQFYTDKSGEKKQETSWHNIACYNQTANFCSNFINKGSRVLIEGSIKYNRYTDKNGNDRINTTIICHQLTNLERKPTDNKQEEFIDSEIPF